MTYRIRLEKENFKFSCSHFTILGPEKAERLHGHNYYVSLELRLRSIDPALGMAFDFNHAKPLIRAITDELDEMVLLPAQSQHLKIKNEGASVRASFGKKEYVFPSDDVRALPLVNISSEELAKFIAEEFIKKFTHLPSVQTVTIGVEETRGQGVFYEIEV